MVHFVGAGPGAPDLITRRGAALLQEADCIIYAGSLVNPALHLDGDTKLEIFVDGDAIVLKKHRPAGSCDFCGDVDANAIQFAGYCICPACRRKIGAL